MNPTGETDTANNSTSARPYRSHKIPACIRCRHRKVRCNIDTPGQPCRLCGERGVPCVIAEPGALQNAESPHDAPPRKRQRKSSPPRQPDTHRRHTMPAGDPWQQTSPTEGPLIVGPAVAEDVQILENYLSSRQKHSSRGSNTQTYRTVFSEPGDSIVYLSVPRRRKGLQLAQNPGRSQLEIIEHILGPSQNELLMLFFEHIHPYFPILDEQTFHALRKRTDEPLSPALLCEIFAIALPLWDRSDVLKSHPRPSVAYLWNMAVAALQEDFMAPSIATVYAALIDLCGRPIQSVMGNILTAGRTVALAYSLGLNRDPTSWSSSSPEEKSLRMRLWWGVLIHDYWSSFAHGTPPNVTKDRYDVPLPTISTLVGHDSREEGPDAGTESFRQLCILTEILGELLPIVYSLKPDWDTTSKVLRRSESQLDDWEAAIGTTFSIRAGNYAPAGYCSLWFGYLSVRLLVARLYLRAALFSSGPAVQESKAYRLASLRETAVTVIDFINSLTADNFREFWLPYSAHLLVSAATLLLRCSIECQDKTTQQACKSRLMTFKNTLQNASRHEGWDIADMCLERCSGPISRIARASTPRDQIERPIDPAVSNDSALGSAQQQHSEVPASESQGNIMDADLLSDMNFYIPADSLDFPWEQLWDVMEGPSDLT
ncbi:hypothetical protein MBLNU457_6726t2 [Dothideomycetes sp. NU457]